MYNIIRSTASQLAFDQYGKLSEQYEQESALRERAESMATEVSEVFSIHVLVCASVASVYAHMYIVL